jgi:hypothetical protein
MSADTVEQSPLFHPTAQLPRAAEERRYWVPLLFATAAALLFSIVAVPRIDFERAAPNGRGATIFQSSRLRRDRPERGRRPGFTQ